MNKEKLFASAADATTTVKYSLEEAFLKKSLPEVYEAIAKIARDKDIPVLERLGVMSVLYSACFIKTGGVSFYLMDSFTVVRNMKIVKKTLKRGYIDITLCTREDDCVVPHLVRIHKNGQVSIDPYIH